MRLLKAGGLSLSCSEYLILVTYKDEGKEDGGMVENTASFVDSKRELSLTRQHLDVDHTIRDVLKLTRSKSPPWRSKSGSFPRWHLRIHVQHGCQVEQIGPRS